MENKQIEAILIFEIVGRPASHIVEALEQMIETLKSEKGITLVNKSIREPKKVEMPAGKEKEDKFLGVPEGIELFSTFAEVEIKAEEIINLTNILFKYLPAHVELLYPEKFNMHNLDFNYIFNDILSKLHNYDSIAKTALMNNQALANQFNEIMKAKSEQRAGVPLEISYGKKEELDNKDKSDNKAKSQKKAKKK